ncbi:hypothetical protein, partial [Hymenobacter latericoloratus]
NILKGNQFNKLMEERIIDGAHEVWLKGMKVRLAIGNLFRTLNSKGGQLRQANGTRYHDDVEGSLVSKTLLNGQQWHYY